MWWGLVLFDGTFGCPSRVGLWTARLPVPFLPNRGNTGRAGVRGNKMQRECRWRGQGLAVPWEPPRERRGEVPAVLSSGLHSINPPEETLFGKKQESSWGGVPCEAGGSGSTCTPGDAAGLGLEPRDTRSNKTISTINN